jgi:hypothetical protein
MYAYDDSVVDGPRTSGMAITSLVLSLVGIIPCLGLLTAAIGALLGLIGLVTISPPRKGKGLAAAGLLLGVVFLGAQAYGGKLLWDFVYRFVEVMETGPRDALNDGFAGNYAAFRGAFHGPGASATNDEAQAFIDALRSRYGEFISSQFPQSGPGNMQPAPGQASLPVPYVLTFENAEVQCEAEIIFADPAQQQAVFINKLGYILVKDPDLGDLRFPAQTAGPAPTDADSDSDADADGDGSSGGA